MSASKPPSRRLRRWFFSVAAVGLGLLAGLLVLEAGLRVFRGRPARFEPPDWYAIPEGQARDGALAERPARPSPHKQASPFGDQVPTGEFVPGVTIRMVYPSNPRGYFDEAKGLLVHVNRLGLRGPEIEPEKGPGVFRVLGLGDSFTFGEGVRDEDTFLRRLEASFDARAQGDPDFQFLNAGVGGYNTYHEVLYLERKWIHLDPDYVLITFFLNDVYSHDTIMERGEEVGATLAQPRGPAEWSYVWDHVQHSLRARAQAKEIERFYRQAYFRDAQALLRGTDARATDWPQSRAGLARAAEIARERDLGLAMVIFPMLYRLGDDHPFAGVHELVREEAAALGIPVLDLLPAFRGRGAADLWVHPGDHHPNEIAHAIAAEAIEPFLAELLGPVLEARRGQGNGPGGAGGSTDRRLRH